MEPFMKHNNLSRKKAFTLIEMLVVIAIIGILAAMLFPAITGAMRTAKINKARIEAESIANAINLYYNDYGQMPVPVAAQGFAPYTGATWTPGNEDDASYFTEAVAKQIIQVLTAEAGGSSNPNANHALNPRRKVYLSMDNPNADGTFLDPWRNQYRIKLDRDFDGKVEYYSQPNQHRTVAVVVSGGPDGWTSGNVPRVPRNAIANVKLATAP